MRPVARNVYKLNISVTPNRDLNVIWGHFVLYHRYTSWQTFLIDRWENLCNQLNGKRISPVLELIHKTFQKNSNINHTCPYLKDEFMSIQTIDRMILNDYLIALPLFPSGDYRFEYSLSEAKDSDYMIIFKFYFTVSDIRVWQ